MLLTQRSCVFVPCARCDMEMGLIQETNIASNQPKNRCPKMSLRTVCRHANVSLSRPLLSILPKKFSTLFSKICMCENILYVYTYAFQLNFTHILYYDWTAHLQVKHINSLFQVQFLSISYLQTWFQVIIVDYTNWRLWDWCNKFAELYYKNNRKILTWNIILLQRFDKNQIAWLFHPVSRILGNCLEIVVLLGLRARVVKYEFRIKI